VSVQDCETCHRVHDAESPLVACAVCHADMCRPGTTCRP
jgi:hypothetical protein